MKNIFVCLLNEMKIKHTKSFSNNQFNEHPHNNNLYGLSKLLSDYNIENKGIKINDRSSVLPKLETPFIAHTGSDFIAVIKNTQEKVEYIWRDKQISISPNEFIKNWSGIVLLVEENEQSSEPNYKEHRKQELISICKNIILTLVVIFFLGIAGFSTKVYSSISLMIALLINLCGIYISYLLILKQMQINSSYADKICSLFVHKSDCNNILESEASKFLGIFSWSEIGLGYFFSIMMIILFYPIFYPYIVLINICALPYTIWSVWYQKIVAKQWCPLCLLIQTTLWVLFINNFTFGHILWPTFTIQAILLSGCIYIFPVLFLNIIIPKLSDAGKMEQVTQKINSVKLILI